MTDWQPAPPPAKKRAKWPWVLGGILLLMVVGFVGCVALVAVAVNETANELDAEQQAHAITQAQFDALEIGMTRTDVIASLGKEPESTQEFVSEGVLSEEEIRSGCIYYNLDGGSWGDRFQLCFDDDTLSSKNAYL